MASGESSAVFNDVSTLFGAGAIGGATDGQLLERFASRGPSDSHDAEAAFTVLVARHGPMVLGVCRRALRDPNDVADAFQATFLVLVRKAKAVRVDHSLGRWLFGVSRRVAARARVDAAKRAAREAKGAVPEAVEAAPDDRGELLAALDAEVGRLPEPFRAAVVLCDLGGLTHEAAARQLGCPVGTIESRLSRGRRRLRDRLAHRGLAPGSLALALGLPAPPPVPPALSLSTARAATSPASFSSTAIHLAQKVTLEMARTKLTLASALVLLTASALGVAYARQTPDQPPPPAVKVVSPTPKPEAGIVLQPMHKARPGDRLLVEVLEALPARPISGERLVRPDGTISLGFYGDLQIAGLNRREIKTKLVKHLQKYLNDDILGLFEFEADPMAPGGERKLFIDPADTNRVFVDDSLVFFPPTPNPAPANGQARRFRPGDRLTIGVLKALPARPLEGERLVRPDGTISLGFYGELQVAGLDRNEVKVKLVKHLVKYLNDEALGLVIPGEAGQSTVVSPAETDRVYVDDAPDVSTEPAPVEATREGPITRIQPGDLLLVEVLIALQGRPISGERLVRPDGTISLGFYGDVKVAGLTRDEIKVKVVEHLKKYLDDEKLGLVKTDAATGKTTKVAPADSAHVFVDESSTFWPPRKPSERRASPAISHSQGPVASSLEDLDRRMKDVESKLDRILKALETPKGQEPR